jgi:hypothetical protein
VKHFLAYGNSDQASFRDPSVRTALDYMTVPGTIAAYYPDATAGFVLTSQLDYMIDPRTPLFQNRIDAPKASHFALADWLGPTVNQQMTEGELIEFRPELFTQGVVLEMTESLLNAQLEYGARAAHIDERLERYRQLLGEALPNEALPSVSAESAPAPAFVLAPYFATSGPADAWWDVNRRIAEACRGRREVSLVLAISDVGLLRAAAEWLPPDVNDVAFFWITGLDERQAPREVLEALKGSIQELRATHRLVNLYGGFFSIALGLFGLWGFNNGLGYSESRSWPELPATGAAPPRYYVRNLHSYLSPATAQLLVDEDAYFRCECDTCSHAPGGSILNLGYHDLKRHFALARRWEINTVENSAASAVADQLREAADRIDVIRRHFPPRVVPASGYLATWSEVLLS